jgi:hypothetical protein
MTIIKESQSSQVLNRHPGCPAEMRELSISRRISVLQAMRQAYLAPVQARNETPFAVLYD